jgi:hypothetical protein
MSNSYAVVSALIFLLVAVGHVLRLINRWTVQIGPYNVAVTAAFQTGRGGRMGTGNPRALTKHQLAYAPTH